MKTIGMIGGMSWESTQIYYRMLNELTRRKLGGLHSASCIIHSVDFAPVETMQREGKWREAGELLAAIAQNLEKAGAEAVVVTSNTMHKLAPQIEGSVNIPLLHIGDAVAENVKKREIGRIALLGTRYTMEESFMTERLENHNLEVITPDSGDRELLNHIIFEELCVGKVRDVSRRRVLAVIEKLYDEGVHGIVLGCTELHMLVRQEELNLPLFDSTQLHVESIAEHMLEGVYAG
ncbi:aspartate/glutamate racemase [Alteribacter lacisalsi]|uniref:Aspartate/glutamate racemase n=1 Tax=Alteribacter lacisalsi TaxID=2045244 RepID=A0A2W0HPA0_9BACI|nr:aspartate/glutamate racemase family protein [Alteribacter lacisalsi]PYZ98912.1 aspartate/glutamate racemase [Alteribacter lacisalsi]